MSLGRVTRLICPGCGTTCQPKITALTDAALVRPWPNIPGNQYAAAWGPCCGRPFLLWFTKGGDEGRIQWMAPRPVSVDVPAHLPPGVAIDFDEARTAHAAGLMRATLLMCRRCIEATADERGCKAGDLVASVDKLAAEGVILEKMRAGAHAIRLLGNEGAHDADLQAGTLTDGDVTLVLEWTRDFLKLVYEIQHLSAGLTAKTKGNRADPGVDLP